MTDYYSKAKCGVDTAKFYRNFGITMQDISNETGCSRQALSGFVIGKSRRSLQVYILEYLSERTRKDYEDTVKNCRRELKEIRSREKKLWQEYFKREKMLCVLRRRYGMRRGHRLTRHISAKEIFMEGY